MEGMHIFSFLAREINLNYSVISTTPSFHSQLDKLIREDRVLLGYVSMQQLCILKCDLQIFKSF